MPFGLALCGPGRRRAPGPRWREVPVTIVIIVIVLVVIVVGGALIARQTSQRRQFGPEYDPLAKEGGPRQARAEFAKRQKRVAGLDLKERSPEQRAAYEARWEAAQEQ